MDWEISNVQVKCDVVTMKSEIEEMVADHMRKGGSIDFNFNDYVSQFQSVSGKDSTVNVQRAASCLKNVRVSIENLPSDLGGSGPWLKVWNHFFHPMTYSDLGQGEYDQTRRSIFN
jgi:hypothetical protein